MRERIAKADLDSVVPAIATCAARLGQDRLAARTWDDEREAGAPSSQELIDSGYSWPTWCKWAGLKRPQGRPRKRVTEADRQRARGAVRRAWREKKRAGGTCLRKKDYRGFQAANPDEPSVSELHRVLGPSWGEAAEQAGVPIGRRSSIEMDPEYGAVLQRITVAVGHAPTMREWNENRYEQRGTLVAPANAKRLAERWGSWPKFLRWAWGQYRQLSPRR